MSQVLDPDPAASSGGTAKLYRVEFPDTSIGYVPAEMVSGTWPIISITDPQAVDMGNPKRALLV